MSEAKFRFASSETQSEQDDSAVFPIVKQEGRKFRIVGTGFFIGIDGIFVTAAHVLGDVFDSNWENQTGPIGAVQFLPNDRYLIRPVVQAAHNTTADICIGLLAETRHNETSALLHNKKLCITPVAPRQGAEIVTYTYQESLILDVENKQKMELKPKFIEGVFQENLPLGRDANIMPHPCYQIDMNIKGGSSGSPVFDSDGRVIGILISSFDGTNIAYCSRIHELMPLSLNNMKVDGGEARKVTVKELIRHDYISVVPPIRFVGEREIELA